MQSLSEWKCKTNRRADDATTLAQITCVHGKIHEAHKGEIYVHSDVQAHYTARNTPLRLAAQVLRREAGGARLGPPASPETELRSVPRGMELRSCAVPFVPQIASPDSTLFHVLTIWLGHSL